jgi:hypothetical protein
LDFEWLRPKEDEGTAALRLIQRVLQNHPRRFDILRHLKPARRRRPLTGGGACVIFGGTVIG